MIRYPIVFDASAEADAGIQSSWTCLAANRESVCAVPKEFEGSGEGLSPEDLFALALLNCFIGTFKVYAEKSKVRFEHLRANASLKVDLNDEKKPVMKSCHLHVKIRGGENNAKLKTIADRAFRAGFILNSVRTDLTFELDMTE